MLVNTENGGTGGVEIWDYKGSKRPIPNAPEFQNYLFQMQVYADLYRQKTGVAPTKAVLYFLNELAPGTEPKVRPVNALLEVNLDPAEVQRALESFGETVQEIETCKATRHWPDPKEPPSQATCDACDLRWSCSATAKLGRKYPLRHP